MISSAYEDQADGAMLSRGLGWFSLVLGATELGAPRVLQKAIGLRPDDRASWLLRALGLRELAHGLAILLRPRRPLPVWSRVAGDALDLAAFGVGALTRRKDNVRAGGALAMLAGAAAMDVIAGRRVQRAYDQAMRPVLAAVTINKPPREVYGRWRNFERLPEFMDYVDSVRVTGPTTSHWVARLPVAGTVEWNAEITDDRPGERIAWRSVEGSIVDVRGVVTFDRAPGRDMTEVRVELQLGLAGKHPSSELARLFAKPQVKGDLRRFKQVVETGEVVISDASAHRKPHPAQPSRNVPRRTQMQEGARP